MRVLLAVVTVSQAQQELGRWVPLLAMKVGDTYHPIRHQPIIELVVLLIELQVPLQHQGRLALERMAVGESLRNKSDG
ncbi:hypothetical protein LguiA_013396 [Lonicera macranthoides]